MKNMNHIQLMHAHISNQFECSMYHWVVVLLLLLLSRFPLRVPARLQFQFAFARLLFFLQFGSVFVDVCAFELLWRHSHQVTGLVFFVLFRSIVFRIVYFSSSFFCSHDEFSYVLCYTNIIRTFRYGNEISSICFTHSRKYADFFLLPFAPLVVYSQMKNVYLFCSPFFTALYRNTNV